MDKGTTGKKGAAANSAHIVAQALMAARAELQQKSKTANVQPVRATSSKPAPAMQALAPLGLPHLQWPSDNPSASFC